VTRNLSTTSSAGTTCRRLQQRFLSTAEAGNLTAHLIGLPIVTRPWTVHEIKHVTFRRSPVKDGCLTP